MVVRYGPIRTETTIAVFPDETGDLADVRARVALVSRAVFRSWVYRHQKITADNKRRVYLLRQEDPSVPETYVTEDCAEQTEALMADVVRAAFLGIEGVEIEGVRASEWSDPARAFDLLSHAGITGSVFAAILRAQAPDTRQSLSSGS